MKILSLFLCLTFINSALACTEDGRDGFLPENDLNIPYDAKRVGGLSEGQFNQVIDRLETIYVPIVRQMGGNLRISRKWKNGTVNASAMRFFGQWLVNMYGGLARHQTITADGFALVLCHEIGHHIGGASKVGNPILKWASNEGQSDYFATLKCLRQTFLNDDNAAVVRSLKAPAYLMQACSKAYKSEADQHICIRAAMAGDSVSRLFASMRSKEPAQFHTPDPKIVSRTNDSHPAFQCRLDTYFQGALCDVAINDEVSQKDETLGTCHGLNGHTTGLRPLCWFKPKIN